MTSEKIGFRSPRAARYKQAIARRKLTQPDLSEADWYREACDRLAESDLTQAVQAFDDKSMVPKP